MLMAVKNQIKVTSLSFKYALMRELLNKVTFISNIVFMILNNFSMIIQWIVLYSLKDNFGGYNFKQLLLLWGISAGSYGFAHVFFTRAFDLSTIINSGKLDSYIVQPKNILLSAITSSMSVSALGDLLFGIIMYFIYGFTIPGFIMFMLFLINGGFILTAIAVILHSLSFWFNNSDSVADVGNRLMVNFATYPDGIFKGITKIILFTLIPVGIASYIPVHIITHFSIYLLIINIVVTILLIIFAFFIFYLGLKRYSSSNLMVAKV